jgi:2-iminobutanoate/2-iminopropanoate deaminase
MQMIQTDQAPAAIGPYSQGIVTGHLVYTSGQISLNPQTGEVVGGDISAQTEQVMKNLLAVLRAAGAGAETVVKTTCFLADMADFTAFNAVYETFMVQKPARSCVAVRGLPKGVLVEVEAVAEVPSRPFKNLESGAI